MLIFWLIAALLLASSLVVLLRPLLLAAKSKSVDSEAEKLAIYKLQFAELELDLANGVLAKSYYDVAKQELQRRLYQEIGAQVAVASNAFVSSRKLAWSILFVLPLLAVLTYQKIGNPGAIKTQSVIVKNDALTEIDPILQSLREKLDKDPNDVTGWALLARANGKLRRYDASIFAFEKAAQLTPDDADLLTDYAVVIAMANNRKVTEKAQALIERALQINPRQTMALMLAASLSFEHHDYKTAITLWERLLPDLPVNSEIANSVSESLAKAHELVAKDQKS